MGDNRDPGHIHCREKKKKTKKTNPLLRICQDIKIPINKGVYIIECTFMSSFGYVTRV